MRSKRFGYFEEEELGKPYDITILKRLMPFIRPYKAVIFGAILLVVLISLIDLSIPYITKTAIDRYIVPSGYSDESQGSRVRHLTVQRSDSTDTIVNKYSDLFIIKGDSAVIRFDDLRKIEKKDLMILRRKDIAGLGIAAMLFIAVIFISFGFNFLQVMIMEYTAQKVMHDLRLQLFSHIQGLAVSFFTHNSVGRLVTRVTNDVQNMNEIFSSMIVFIFKDLLLIIGVTVVILGINTELAFVSFAVIPFIFCASLFFAGRNREVFRTLRLKIAEITSRFSETISGIKILQLFRQEQNNYRDFEVLNHEYYLAGVQHVHILAAFLRFTGFLDSFVVALVIFYGGGKVLSGTISIGELVAFIAYMKMFFSPIQDIAQRYNLMQNAMASAERILLILDSSEKLPVASHFRPQSNSISELSEIELDKVFFSYLPDEPVLKEVSFKIHAGNTVAIVGPTGSGKTSLINLIIRFYDPVAGQVRINGNDLKELDISAVRAKMALVTQDPFLFSGTIRENIFQGNGSFSPQEIEHILELSNCKGFIDRLAKGADTELSEGGASISSGERQLISIARAFARNPELIILDEATSYIDSETEAGIQDALANLMQNRTSLIVAHRLSTARNADTIMVLHKGQIIESGTHEELMRLKGFYFRLNLLQR